MDEQSRLILEQEGFKVIQKDHVDPHWGTRDFVQLPDGRTLAQYSYMFEIPSWLNDKDEFTMLRTGIPEEIRPYEFETDLWGFDENLTVYDGTLLIPPAIIGYVIWIIIGLVLVMGFYFIIDKILRPCGEGWTEWLNDCWKIIVMPDCKYIRFNSCADPDGDGIPEGEFEGDWEGGVPDIGEILKWIAITAAVVGGIYVTVKVLPAVLRKKELPPARAPGIEYVG